jgi:hypothetical protein
MASALVLAPEISPPEVEVTDGSWKLQTLPDFGVRSRGLELY